MKFNPNPVLMLLAAAALATSLSACAPLVIGGAAVGTLMAYDRRTSGAQVEDEGIELHGASALRQTLGDRAHFNITSYNRQVLLTGEVPREQDKQAAQQAVSGVENVKGVVNELGVMLNTSLAQRSNDTLITGKVKASLVDNRNLSVSAFKVVTERGVVYLMGRVTQREADLATQITRNINGVQRVVRLFEIITDDEARRLQAPFGASAPAPAPRAAPVPTRAPAAAPVMPPPAPAGATTSPAAASSAAPTALPSLTPHNTNR
jgi:osmotically-inducible protein OsmY